MARVLACNQCSTSSSAAGGREAASLLEQANDSVLFDKPGAQVLQAAVPSCPAGPGDPEDKKTHRTTKKEVV